MRNKITKGITLLMTLCLMSGCLSSMPSDTDDVEATGPNEVTVQTTTNQLTNQFYRAVITDGHYDLGTATSADYTLNSAGNIRAFEEGLMRISQSVFPTDQYYLQQGQVIDNETMTSWLGRESMDNPEGLNPALPEIVEVIEEETEESVDPADDPETGETTEEDTEEDTNQQVITEGQVEPIYLSQIMEKNMMIETEEGFVLNGIVIGLAMNSMYEYSDQDGVIHQQEISVGEIRERGKQLANIIVGRLRNTEALRSVPIVVGVFRNAPNDELAGGTFLIDGISREGNSVTDWTEKNEYRIALPLMNNDDQSEQYTYFDNFRAQVIDFFPNLNGISGEALYVDGTLLSLKIEIVTQFYEQTEIAALSQHVMDVAMNQLPSGAAIEITMISEMGTEAYVGRPSGSTNYQSHIFY